MSRGYRGVISAVAGLILIGASDPPKPPAQAEHAQPQHTQSKTGLSVAPTPVKAPEPVQALKDKQPCGQSRYTSNDDLCAQWKAADAASDAAKWAWVQVILSALGVLGLGVTLWFNFRALSLTRKMASDTSTALIIARHAERAHINVCNLIAEIVDEGMGQRFRVTWVADNTGNTPGHITKVPLAINLRHPEVPEFPRVETNHKILVNPAKSISMYAQSPTFYIDNSTFDVIVDGLGSIFVWGKVVYDDVFGSTHESHFGYEFLCRQQGQLICEPMKNANFWETSTLQRNSEA